MNGVNIPLLRKAVEWAEAEAAKGVALSLWRQSGYVWPTSREEAVAWGYDAVIGEVAAQRAECGTAFCVAGHVVNQMLGPIPIGTVLGEATRLLGLNPDSAQRLFNSENTIEDVRRIAESIAGERL